MAEQLTLDFSNEGALRRDLEARGFRSAEIDALVAFRKKHPPVDNISKVQISVRQLGRAIGRGRTRTADVLKGLAERGFLAIDRTSEPHTYHVIWTTIRLCATGRSKLQRDPSQAGGGWTETSPPPGLTDQETTGAQPAAGGWTETSPVSGGQSGGQSSGQSGGQSGGGSLSSCTEGPPFGGTEERENERKKLHQSFSQSISPTNPVGALESLDLTTLPLATWTCDKRELCPLLDEWLPVALSDADRKELLGAVLAARSMSGVGSHPHYAAGCLKPGKRPFSNHLLEAQSLIEAWRAAMDAERNREAQRQELARLDAEFWPRLQQIPLAELIDRLDEGYAKAALLRDGDEARHKWRRDLYEQVLGASASLREDP